MSEYQGPSIIGSIRVLSVRLPLVETITWSGWPEDLDVPVPPSWIGVGLDGVKSVRRESGA